MELARIACETIGEDDAVVRWCLGVLASIGRGDRGYRGRHVGERLRAVVHILDRRLGKPPQTVRHSGKLGLTLEDLLSGKLDETRDRGD